MLDPHKLRRRTIVIEKRRALRFEVCIEGGERIVHRHRPAHDLLLVVADRRHDRVGAEKDRPHQIILNLRRVLEFVHEQMRVSQTQRISRHRS